MISECLCAAVTRRDNVFDQFGKKLCPGMFFVERFCRLSRAHDIIELEPGRNQSLHVHRKKPGERPWFIAYEKSFAFRCERIFVAVLDRKSTRLNSSHRCISY